MRWLLVAIWMAIIFLGSTDMLSSQRTSRFIAPLLRWFNPNVTPETIQFVQAIVRKSGHVAEYALLAALAWRAVRPLMLEEKQVRPWRTAILAFLIATLYAVTDEYHQSFVATRLGSAGDVLIDAIGAFVGLAILWFWSQRRSRMPSPEPLRSAQTQT